MSFNTGESVTSDLYDGIATFYINVLNIHTDICL